MKTSSFDYFSQFYCLITPFGKFILASCYNTFYKLHASGMKLKLIDIDMM
jgi:hypothetical protein